MKYLPLGHTGLDISRICLGCMTYGNLERRNHPWTRSEQKSRPLIRRALELGYIDLYQIHRWDDATPIEETLEALHDEEIEFLEESYVPHAVTGFV